MKLKDRTLRLLLEYSSLDSAIQELLAVKKNLHGLHVNTSETRIELNEIYSEYDNSSSTQINLHYMSEMTATELAEADAYLQSQKDLRQRHYNELHEEFGAK